MSESQVRTSWTCRRKTVESLRNAWSGLDVRRRLAVGVATIAMFAAILALARGAATQDMALLYAGLDSSAAGEVVAALEQRGIPFEVRGDAIYVPQAARDIERMALAAEGLPASSSQGYELLDSLSGFGTTSQMFDAAYWRAKEGELARTILSVPNIRSARVHISAPTNRPFQREEKTTAAVTVLTNGGALTASQADALRHLVSSSVSGLSSADVAVIDGENGLIPTGEAGGAAGLSDRSEDLRSRAQRLLEARVGIGNAVVELSLETVTETESFMERRFDPESRVAISTEVEETSSQAQNSGPGDVTVASNLPDGDGADSEGGSNSQDTTSRALTNFEVSETSREVIREPGAVKRLTVAVLVNDVTTLDDLGNATVSPRSEEELGDLRDLVASAVGFDESRGDVITIKSMAFEPVTALGTEATIAPALPLDLMSLIRLGVLALVAVILGLFVVRPILRSARPAPALPALEPLPLEAPIVPAFTPIGFAGADLGIADAEIVDPVTRLRRLIEERQDETAQILQNWIEEPDTKERV
jgi:flagellar M-ring protein FliF